MISLSVVLVRPLFSGNLGSVARAMKNMGLKELRLVAPKADPKDLDARKMAAHAADVLKAAKTFKTLPAALKGFHFIAGTSRRKGKERSNWADPREFARSLLDLPSRQKIALVFGPEDSGLRNEEVALCHRMICIPSSRAFASLNLAQAVMVLAYECFVARQQNAFQSAQTERVSVAKAEALEGMYADLGNLLLEIGFLHKQNPRHLMRLIRNLFNRARPTDKEVRIIRGMCRQVRWWGKA